MLLPWLKHYDLLIFDRIDSTNDEAIRLLKAGIRGSFVIISRVQTKGKGQLSRVWQSVDGNMHASILLPCDLNINRLTELSFLAAVAIHDAIFECVNDFKAPKNDISLKWPNDVLIGGKKVAGILLESLKVDKKNYVIVGMGVNTHFMPDVEGKEITSLLNEGIVLKNSDDFLSKVMSKFHTYYSKWQKENSFNNIRNTWLKRAYGLNRQVTFNDGKNLISGIFKGINDAGNAIIELDGGKIRSFAAGELSLNKIKNE